MVSTQPGAPVFALRTVRAFCDAAVADLGAAREEIDALNIYPVPDGDTGTNMFLTFQAGRDALRAHAEEQTSAEPDVGGALQALGRGALLGARGNSGVITAQLVGAFARRVARGHADQESPNVFAEAMVEAADAAYEAVSDPVEGTILSVARAAADAARQTATSGAELSEVIAATAAAARQALQRTPEQLEVLSRAGVVDAGGRGLCVLLDAAETTVTGRRPPEAPDRLRTRSIPVPQHAGTPEHPDGHRLGDHGPAYEVMYLLDAADEAIPSLRRALAPLGDSLVVVGGDRLWNVHVHVDDVGAAIEAGIAAGTPRRIRVTHFAEQVALAAQRSEGRSGGTGRPGAGSTGVAHGADRASRPSGTPTRAVVAFAFGDGLAALFDEAGAHVVSTVEHRRPSVAELVEAIRTTGAGEVLLLPNDSDTVGVADIAARTVEESHDVRISVVPSRTQVQGLAALAVHEPGRGFDADLVAMVAASRAVRHGAVTVAARQAMTTAGPCEPGDALGVIGGDFAVVGDHIETVAVEVVDRLIGAGGELVTLVAGAEGEGLAQHCADHLAQHHPTVDVAVYEGGQPRYPLLVGVE
ncbi:DAK2 domain-containing protein [Nocardioidaceae bacterium]|nr:DAK2 domain-containing protein [Nocardioidaceae bacterium]